MSYTYFIEDSFIVFGREKTIRVEHKGPFVALPIAVVDTKIATFVVVTNI